MPRNTIGEADIKITSDAKGFTRDLKRKTDAAALDVGNSFNKVLGTVMKSGAITSVGLVAAGSVPQLLSLAGSMTQVAGAAALLPGVLAASGAAFATLKVGFSGFGDALKSMGDPKAFAAALKNLSVNAGATAAVIKNMQPAFTALKLDVQQKLFAGVSAQVRDLGKIYLPILRKGMGDVATASSKAFGFVAEAAKSKAVTSDLIAIFKDTAAATTPFGKAMATLLPAFTEIAKVGASFLPGLATGFANAAKTFGDFITRVSNSGALKDFIQGGLDALKSLGDVAINAGKILGGLFKAAQAAGGGTLATLADGLGKIAGVINSPAFQKGLTGFFEGLMKGSDGVLSALPAIGDLLGTLGPIIGNLAATLGPILGVALTGVAKTFEALAPAVDQVIKALGPAIGAVFGALAEVLPQIATALAPVITALAVGLAPVIQALAPIMVLLGGAIVKLVTAFAPLITQLITQLTPIVTEMISTILPPLIQIFESLIPVITEIASAIMPVFIEVLKTIIPIVAALLPPLAAWIQMLSNVLVPIIQFLAPLFQAVWHQILDAVTNTLGPIVSFISTAIFWIRDNWSSVWNTVKSVVSGIWSAIKGIVSSAIQNVVDKVNGVIAVVKIVQDAFEKARVAVGEKLTAALKLVTDLPGKIISGLGNLGNLLYSVGADIIRGMIKGVTDMAGNAIQAVKNVVGNMISGAKGLLGISSPSKVFKQIGTFTVEGLIQGLKSGQQGAADMIGKLITQLTKSGEKGAAKLAQTLSSKLQIGTLGARLDFVRDQIETAKDKLKATVDAYNSTFNSILSNLRQSGAFKAGVKSFEAITKTMAAHLAKTQEFAAALKALSGLGLNKEIMNQLAAGGLASLDAAKILAASGKAGIDQVNALQNQIDAASSGAATTVAKALHQDSINAATAYLKVLQNKENGLVTQMTNAGKALIAAIVKAVNATSGGLSSSLVKGFATGTRNFPGGLGLVGERGPEMVRLPRGTQIDTASETRRQLAGFGGGTSTTTVYVSMAVSIDDLAKMTKVGDFLDMLDRSRVDLRRVQRSGTVNT